MIHSAQGVAALKNRLGDELHAKRLKRQHDKLTKFLHQGRGIFRIERLLPFDLWLSLILHLTGVKKRMLADFLDVRLVEKEWFFPNLPPSFEGFRLLHLTDLHCDLEPALMPIVIDLVHRTQHDAAVLTGDYRNGMEGDHGDAMRAMVELRKALAPDCWGILGNHDPPHRGEPARGRIAGIFLCYAGGKRLTHPRAKAAGFSHHQGHLRTLSTTRRGALRRKRARGLGYGFSGRHNHRNQLPSRKKTRRYLPRIASLGLGASQRVEGDLRRAVPTRRHAACTGATRGVALQRFMPPSPGYEAAGRLAWNDHMATTG